MTEVKGLGWQKGQTEIRRGAEYSTGTVPGIRIEAVCAPDLAPRMVETIHAAADTGAIGDGKSFVLGVGQAVRIRAGETDHGALRWGTG